MAQKKTPPEGKKHALNTKQKIDLLRLLNQRLDEVAGEHNSSSAQ